MKICACGSGKLGFDRICSECYARNLESEAEQLEMFSYF